MPATLSAPTCPGRRFSLLYAVLRGCVIGFVAAWTVEILYMFVGTNVHVVAAGAVYRCARLDPVDLKSVVHEYKIRTLFNLCGCSDPEPWYKQESLTTCQLDICQEDLTFSAGRLPSIYTLHRLVEALDRCDYPILIHCHRGIDRTGMASYRRAAAAHGHRIGGGATAVEYSLRPFGGRATGANGPLL